MNPKVARVSDPPMLTRFTTRSSGALVGAHRGSGETRDHVDRGADLFDQSTDRLCISNSGHMETVRARLPIGGDPCHRFPERVWMRWSSSERWTAATGRSLHFLGDRHAKEGGMEDREQTGGGETRDDGYRVHREARRLVGR